MKPPIEDPNISVTQDSEVFGDLVGKGTKITIVSKQGEFNGQKIRIPPPEFEALMLQTAISSALNAVMIKKEIQCSKSKFDSVLSLDVNDENHFKFFEFCKHSMSSIAFSISSAESWSNKSIALLGQTENGPMKLIFKRPNKPEREVLSDSVASDRFIPFVSKIFQFVPQVFHVDELKESSTLRKDIKNLVEDRNVIMHMQQKLTLNNIESERASFAVKLFSVNPFRAPDAILKYMDYVYSHSGTNAPEWLEDLRLELKKSKRRIK